MTVQSSPILRQSSFNFITFYLACQLLTFLCIYCVFFVKFLPTIKVSFIIIGACKRAPHVSVYLLKIDCEHNESSMAAGGELSYEELLDHILNNKPIPNIVEVPNVTLDEGLASTPSLRPRPRPWEGQLQHQSHQGSLDKPNISLDIDQESLEGMTSLTRLSECYDIQSKLQINDSDNDNDDNNNDNNKGDGNDDDNNTVTANPTAR
ncbi:hypothetical protein H791_YJM1273J00232 [Saccharomyces cerevisiae YJM1273]|nr:hypothetical protein H819_YJM1434J00232 [Saccharomyces cerevisiae YJM1434]AJR70849.1 hypothetical protein H821_YJM1443J00228 [Saccharomyces cerevisiae YJM1443]AJV38767.1 hypothetical protein H791_YJM1273J00232 [Saccharomyces cerevisiae YJM1273]